MKQTTHNRIPKLIIFSCLLFLSQLVVSQTLEKDTIRVYYLCGQSNMDGFGLSSELPDSLNIDFENIWIFHGNPVSDNEPKGGIGTWAPLKPGHGNEFKSNHRKNKLSDKFGVELSFAKQMQHFYPNETIALIKYSMDGSGLDSIAGLEADVWDPIYPGVNQFDNYLKTIQNSLSVKDINGDGKEDYLLPSGILWMQGETDGNISVEIANRYYKNLTRLMGAMRDSINGKELSVVIGKISDSYHEGEKTWDFGHIVQEAQEKFAKNDANAAIVRSTKNYKYSDKWHYDSKGFIDLGVEFAKKLYELESRE